MLTLLEKKRKDGQISYPLWEGNIMIPWAAFAVLFAVLISAFTLPRYVGLARNGVAAEGVISIVKDQEVCDVSYRYKVAEKAYEGTDHFCGLKPGTPHAVYYDAADPETSTLYVPRTALQNILISTLLLCLCLPTVLVFWLKATYIIGSRKKT